MLEDLRETPAQRLDRLEQRLFFGPGDVSKLLDQEDLNFILDSARLAIDAEAAPEAVDAACAVWAKRVNGSTAGEVVEAMLRAADMHSMSRAIELAALRASLTNVTAERDRWIANGVELDKRNDVLLSALTLANKNYAEVAAGRDLHRDRSARG